ncbi:MAG: hypothetical protein JWN56_1030 [Sphingobacteriales bacterium]|nr:hypothetical protein [Sphingobacteriales bacterium]
METTYANCKCWKKPFEPPKGCFEYCAAKILLYSKPSELQDYFDLSIELAYKIFDLTANDTLLKLTDYKGLVTDQEYQEISMKLSYISNSGWDWITTTFKARVEAEESVYA